MIEQINKVPLKCLEIGFKLMKDYNQLEDLKNLKLPFVIVHGMMDIIAWEAEKGGFKAVLMNVPDVGLVKYGDVGLCPHWELPEKVADIIRIVMKKNKVKSYFEKTDFWFT